MNNCWMIAMDYITTDFEKLEEEWKKNKKIMWQVHGKPKFKTKLNKYVIDYKESKATQIKTGDIIYFYVTNIKSNGGSSKSRVLLRGIVEDEPKPVENNKVYLESKDTHMIIGFSIGNITTLRKEYLEDDRCLSLNQLKDYEWKENRKSFVVPHGTTWPNQNNGNLSDSLIEFLEQAFKKSLDKEDLQTLINHFNPECFFADKIKGKYSHKTFKRRNGTDYYEIHHFIQQHKGRKVLELTEIIDASENKICLCSNCHNRIHYGKIEDVDEMINLLWKDEKIQNFLSENHFSSKVEGDPLDWIKKTYISNYEFARKDNDNIK